MAYAITREHHLHCDGVACKHSLTVLAIHGLEFAIIALKAGWTLDAEGHFCPTCSAPKAPLDDF